MNQERNGRLTHPSSFILHPFLQREQNSMMSCSRMSWMRGSTSARVGRRDTRPSGGSPPSALEVVGRRRRVALQVEPHQLQGPRPVLQPHQCRRPAADRLGMSQEWPLTSTWPWRHQLAGAGPVGRPAEPMHDVVEAPLHDGQAAARRCSRWSARPARNSGGTAAPKGRRSASASASRGGGCRTRSACRGGSRACRGRRCAGRWRTWGFRSASP